MVGNMTASCCQLMNKLAQADFFAQDLKLYLDTHPGDMQALKMYREAVKQAKQCKKAFEASCYPLCAESAGENGDWNWPQGLWM